MGEVTGKTWTDYSEPRIMAADLEAIEAAIVEAAASTIVGVGRPDIPATLTTPGTAALVAAATSGTVFRSTDGPQGAWEWRKKGTTWTVTDGDTGWRNITPGPEWAGQLTVRRSNGLVILLGNSLTSGAGGVPTGTLLLSPMPDGFALPFSFTGAVAATRSGTDGLTSRVIQGTVMYGPTLPAGASLKFRQEFEQDGPWPTTLPGTPA